MYFSYSPNVELHHIINPGCTTTIKTICGILSLSLECFYKKTVYLITSPKPNYIIFKLSNVELHHIINPGCMITMKTICSLIASTKTKTNYIFFLLSECLTASRNKPRLYYYYKNPLWHIISLSLSL